MKSSSSVAARARVQGFTLIELVIVIVIVGILAAVALPKFFDMGSSARTASNSAVFGALNSAMAIAHSAALVGNVASAPTATVTLDGGTSVALAYGYPTAAAIGSAVNTGASTPTTTATTATWSIAGGAGTCSVVYTAATSASVAASAVQTISGC